MLGFFGQVKVVNGKSDFLGHLDNPYLLNFEYSKIFLKIISLN